MTERFYADDEGDGSEEEETLGIGKFGGRDSVIFAIDCCREMFELDGENSEDTPFNRIIEAIHDMYLNKIITSDKDLHGIIFFGTKKNNSSSDFSNIFVWQKLDIPSVKSITELRDMQKINAADFDTQFGNESRKQMSEVFWESLNMLSATSYKLAAKSLIVFTWNDNPHFGDNNAKKRAKTKAQDLHDHDVDIQVMSFNKNFKYEPFYKDIISDPDSEDPFNENPIDCIQNLYSFLLKKCTKQRTLSRIPLFIGDDIEISVGVYTVARRTTKTAAISIDSSSNQEAKRSTNFIDTNTGEILLPSDIKLMQTWAGKEIVFEKEEIQNMRKIGKHGLHVLGFKPRSAAVKAWYHVRNSQFIYPNEERVKGSTTLFHALLVKCLAKDVVAICSYTARPNSPPRCVALLPQDEEINPETSEQITPPGFYVIFLPFADDIREVDFEPEQPKPTNEQIEAAENLVRKLKFTYNPESFDNPAIQTHYKNLEAMALEKEQPDKIDDHTKPDTEIIDKKAGAYIQAFKQAVFPPGYDPLKKATKHKSSSTASKGGKKPKEDMVDVKEYVSQGKLGKLTVQGLKEICRKYNIKGTGKKADIIQAIEDHFT
ncbi:unnamed protein product [Clavelina lepadiformis]|uniref:ATP-dependent DNA helicase 2 subunit 1 n=1 Tax=Clavelina lepadiformis TaxID=159417 RepID=A0ABP0F7K4_CLALP